MPHVTFGKFLFRRPLRTLLRAAVSTPRPTTTTTNHSTISYLPTEPLPPPMPNQPTQPPPTLDQPTQPPPTMNQPTQPPPTMNQPTQPPPTLDQPTGRSTTPPLNTRPLWGHLMRMLWSLSTSWPNLSALSPHASYPCTSTPYVSLLANHPHFILSLPQRPTQYASYLPWARNRSQKSPRH